MRQAAVIIPCHNAAHCVGRQLAALSRQRTSLDWELVIVDDGSTDELRTVVARHESNLPAVTVVTMADRGGTGAARNAGAGATDAATLLFLDADDLIDAGYLDAMAWALTTADIVTARVDYVRLNSAAVLRSTPADQLCDVLTPSLFRPHVLGGLMGVSRELFMRLGGFDDAFPALADIDFSWRAQIAGERIGVADTVVAISLRATHRARLRRGLFQSRDIVALRDKFAAYGVDPVDRRSHLRGWVGVAVAARRFRDPTGRSETVWNLGWQLGEFQALRARRRRADRARRHGPNADRIAELR